MLRLELRTYRLRIDCSTKLSYISFILASAYYLPIWSPPQKFHGDNNISISSPYRNLTQLGPSITNQLLYQLSYISTCDRNKGWQLYAPATAPANPSLPSPVLEGRLALLHERLHALLLVFYAEARMKQPALEANAFVERGLERPVDGLLGH